MIRENLQLRREDARDDPCTLNFMVPPILEMSVLYLDLALLDKAYLESFQLPTSYKEGEIIKLSLRFHVWTIEDPSVV